MVRIMKTARLHVLLMPLLALVVTMKAAWADDPFVVELVAKDGRFQPAKLIVPSARKIKIVIRNEGNGPMEFESLDLHKEKVLTAGARSFVIIAPLRPGSYEFVDEFHPDTGRGQIIVRP